MKVRKAIILTLLSLLPVHSLTYAQKKLFNETPEQRDLRMQWWTNDRLGMFIHFGLYALPARGEWVKNIERMTNDQYKAYFDLFNPDKLDVKAWARMAKAAGMKYVVLTAKHHEGFCLFDSKYTDYKVTNTPYGRDIIKDYVEALRAEGLKVGFYYSLIDWHHPDFTVDWLHPQRLEKGADYTSINRARDMDKYRAYLFNQVRELLTRYGKIDILWLDMSYGEETGKGRKDWDSENLVRMVRKLQPDIIINDRLELGEYADGADFESPEQLKPEELAKFTGKHWETCQTFSGLWGYSRDENTWKTHRQLLDLLISAVGYGGNLILNVGPTARGEFDYRAKAALDSLGNWMSANDASIYGCSAAPAEFKAPEGTKLTYNKTNRRLYVHIFEYHKNKDLVLPGYAGKLKYAQFLNDESQLIYRSSEGSEDLKIKLPNEKPPFEIPVIELLLE